MEQLLYKIFEEHKIDKISKDFECFSLENQSFFFMIDISEADLLQIKNTQSFHENKDYIKVLEVYRETIKNIGLPEIEKNSSLIVTVKCDDLISLTNLQQQILLIEENEYFFKKYVILYTDESIINILQNPSTVSLNSKLNDSVKFDLYSDSGYNSSLLEYMVILQLFIKLPFLKLSFSLDEYLDLNNKLENLLKKDITIFNRLVNFKNEIVELNFMNIDDERKINLLLKMISDD